MTIAVHVEDLSKRYLLGARSYSIRDLVNSTTSNLVRRATGRAKSERPLTAPAFWALKNVSFDIRSGEIVGIIGRNGAGKSTLLKILSRIVAPTSGQVTLRGRVASLLEVGTGFHAELTGRENVYLNGAVLGMSKAEIRKKFDEIIAFAEIEKFIDTPVKRYSSGMYVRLAFAVAAHLEPEILIVDEVLTVGDASFQRKCLSKIGDVGKGGRTVLFVTHNMLALRSLCDRAILLDKGEVVLDAEPETATFAYLQSGGGECRERHFDPNDEHAGANGVRLHSVRIRPEGDETQRFTVDTKFFVEFDWEHVLPDTLLHLNLEVNTPDGLCVFNTLTQPQHYQVGRYVSRCEIPGNLLNDGVYHLSLAFYQEIARPVHTVDDIAIFEIHDKPRDLSWFGKWPGVVRPDLNWQTQVVEASVVPA